MARTNHVKKDVLASAPARLPHLPVRLRKFLEGKEGHVQAIIERSTWPHFCIIHLDNFLNYRVCRVINDPNKDWAWKAAIVTTAWNKQNTIHHHWWPLYQQSHAPFFPLINHYEQKKEDCFSLSIWQGGRKQHCQMDASKQRQWQVFVNKRKAFKGWPSEEFGIFHGSRTQLHTFQNFGWQ